MVTTILIQLTLYKPLDNALLPDKLDVRQIIMFYVRFLYVCLSAMKPVKHYHI